ncbi:hypothetical protein GUJ93_ZPchr0007g6431 [Zizania palustris]|uniref:Legume lectin domain-containing protein n=1 Tax=Zizania palustris TaxID=103762 RepID=A0A8J5TE45_ZIZPA|nr:hypothetical protein GUJ93_ZPchr0007g6431 [Zizania palustris]
MAIVAPLAAAAVCLPASARRAMAPPTAGARWGRRRRGAVARAARRRRRGLVVVGEFGGTYEDGFEDVHTEIVNYFTYKATSTVLHQLYEMNPPAYTWLYNYIVVNDPKEGKHFLVGLAKERQDLAERVMITRLHLYSKWVKKCDHTKMYEKISNENLEIMRQRLMETVAWPTDDTNTSDKSNHNASATIQLHEDAFYNRAIKLTKDELSDKITHSVGQAVYTDPVPLWDSTTDQFANFTTRFTFRIYAHEQQLIRYSNDLNDPLN